MFRTCTDVMRPAIKYAEETKVTRFYICDLCSDGWASETEVEIHRANYHSKFIADMYREEGNNVCKMCASRHKDEDAMIEHIKTEHLLSSPAAIRVEREIFICDVCSEIYFNKMMLAHHIHHSHMPKSQNSTYKCPTCLKNVRHATSWYHFRGHKLQSIACCKICCKKFQDRLGLLEHLKTHPYYYRCQICGYDTKKLELFNYHINSVHKKVDRRMNNAYNWERYFVPHEYPSKWKKLNLMGWRGVILTNGIHICILCREICVDEDSMKRHILLDHVDEVKTIAKYLCSCGMVFTSKVLLKHHNFKFKELHM